MTTLPVARAGRWGRTLSTGMLAGVAAALLVGLLAAYGSEQLGYDFRVSYLPAAQAVVDGESPYPAPDDASLESDRGYVYPPPLALVAMPFTLLSTDLAALLAVLGAAASLVGALALVGVRDLRCHAAAVASAPAWNALEMANASALLALCLALVWRYRADARRAGLALGLAIAAKLVLWPLLVWSAASERLRLGGWALLVAGGTVALSWAALGFAGLVEYPELVRRLSEIQAERSYSFAGMAAALGLPEAAGRGAGLAVAGVLLVSCVVLGRRGDDLGSFACALLAGLAATPVLWLHYLVLLFVPLAAARPRFSWPWLVPLVLWISPRAGHGDGLEPFAPALAATVLAVAIVTTGHARSRPVAAAL